MATKVKKSKKPIKLTVRDSRTGLEIDGDRLVIKSAEDAKKAVAAGGKLIEKMSEIRVETGLDTLEGDYEMIRKSLRDWQKENLVSSISSRGWASMLVERTKSFWVWSEADIPENIDLEDDVAPLKDVIRKRFRNLKERSKITGLLTKRVIIPSALDDAVKNGLLSQDDITDSLAEYVDASYVQIKPEKS